eukprot:CAMPEP_0197831820 /NCGR_PEP_ID=MMETSP1437-20131217/12277_1 /TAXON_ID=49252 ORGANISM="Eucampia antarctica, Strain CCMP1452" /NCGR_SAMPLE_ID=MMETSP1437 /ASSEMBLY_ACC=CAM_ASM_001096 /LENGTH=223 /DNA_ID=CAMNT_0043434907 /DNA_START=60 /DNA_END=731 /DNA_ORIENTATION=+
MKSFSIFVSLIAVILHVQQTHAQNSKDNLRQVYVENGALDNVQPINAENTDFRRRRLSFWTWVLDMVHCPPGPLGKHCHSSSGSSGSSSSSSSSSSTGDSDSDSNSAKSDTGTYDDDMGSGVYISNDMDLWTSSGSSINSANGAENTRATGFYWGIGFATAIAGAFAVSRIINKPPSIATAHLLDGAVKKRNLRFSRAIDSTGDTMEMSQTNPSGLEGGYVRA